MQQSLSMLIYAVVAVVLFGVVIALFGGGYNIGINESGNRVYYLDEETANIVEHERSVDSLWQQYSRSLSR